MSDKDVLITGNNQIILLTEIRRLINDKDFKKALVVCEAGLRDYPQYDEFIFLKGVIYQNTDELEKARLIYESLIGTSAETGVYYNLGVLYGKLKNPDKAILYYEKALEKKPNYFDARFNLAHLLNSIGELFLANYHYEILIQQHPDNVKGIHSYAVNCDLLGLTDKALWGFERANSLKNDSPEYHTNYGIELLLVGEYEKGWQEYGWRHLSKERKRQFTQAEWQGESLVGKRILVCVEQGIGDALHFMRYLPFLKGLGAEIVWEVHKELYTLCYVQKKVDIVLLMGSPLPKYDYYIHLLTLPRIFKTNLSNIPSNIPYLFVPEKETRAWAEKLQAFQRFRVGIVWAGSPQHHRNAQRSCGLKAYLPFLSLPNIDFFSLQKKHELQQLDDLPETIKITNLDSLLNDYLDTAACIQNLDLIISIDTSIVHAAGALGKEVWVFIPYVPDWRWGLTGDTTPWYPTMRLFRQNASRDWTPVIEAMTEALKVKVSSWVKHN
jgi:Tfp pilus assembly protein PilF